MTYYHLTIGSTPGKDVFGRDMTFNLASVVDWRVIIVTNMNYLGELQSAISFSNIKKGWHINTCYPHR